MGWDGILSDTRSDDVEQENEENLNQFEDLYEETVSYVRRQVQWVR